MADLAQLVRASDCGSEGRGFEPHIPPFISGNSSEFSLFFMYNFFYKILCIKLFLIFFICTFVVVLMA